MHAQVEKRWNMYLHTYFDSAYNYVLETTDGFASGERTDSNHREHALT